MRGRGAGATCAGLAAMGLGLGAGQALAAPPAYAWSQLAPEQAASSGLLARAVVDSGDRRCPVLEVQVPRRDGPGRLTVELPMQRNAAPSGAVGFDGVFGCRRAIPERTVRARIGGLSLPLLPDDVRSIGVLGDTGCRIKGSVVQDCNDPSAFPLARVARQLARSSPDAVLHVGDYFYREEACPPSEAAKCGGSPPPNPAGSPNEDNWQSWRADWFRHVGPLLRAAPIAFVRGNHEVCRRGGVGFFLLIDPRLSQRNHCRPIVGADGRLTARPDSDQTPAYEISLADDLAIAMLDSSGDDDVETTDAALAVRQFGPARQIAQAHDRTLVATHRPVFGYEVNDASTGTTWINASEQLGLRQAPLAGRIDAFLAGHMHTFQAVDIPGQPPQLVFGNGGTLLDERYLHFPDPPAYAPLEAPDDGGGPGIAPYPAPRFTLNVTRFGFGLMRLRQGRQWIVDSRDDAGRRLALCRTRPTSVVCARS